MASSEDQTPQGATATSTNGRIAAARRTIKNWMDHQLGQIDLGNWPTSAKFWFYVIDTEAHLGPDIPTAVIGFMAKALAYQPGSAWSDGYAGNQGAAERDGFSFSEYMGKAPHCSDSFYHTQALAWYEARLNLVPEDKWASDVIEWTEAMTSELDDAPPVVVLGWLGQVLVDPGIPSDLYEPLGSVMKTF